MESNELLLVVNTGSTSTKLAYYDGAGEVLLEEELTYQGPPAPAEQLPDREKQVRNFIGLSGYGAKALAAVVSRGGLLRPLPAGVYAVNEQMCQDLLKEKYGRHSSALGPLLAYNLAREYSCPAFTVDPPSTDEFFPLARFSGIPFIERKSAFHALSQKAAARYTAAELGLKYEEGCFVVAHLGGGITVGAHLKGRVVDASHGLSEGPLTPERAGSLPVLELLDLFSRCLVERTASLGKTAENPLFTRSQIKDLIDEVKGELKRLLVGGGGLMAYLGTKDVRELLQKIAEGRGERERLLLEVMAYQVSKEICSYAAALKERPHALVLTGALTRSPFLVEEIKKRTGFLAPVYLAPENEMLALAGGAIRVLKKEEDLLSY